MTLASRLRALLGGGYRARRQNALQASPIVDASRPSTEDERGNPPKTCGVGNSNPGVDLRYSLGFVVGHRLTWVPEHFVSVSFACPLHVHPNTSVAVSSSDGKAIAIVGEAIHPEHSQASAADIVNLLLRCENRQSEIDKLVGRFAILESDQRRQISIQTDAIAMRSVYFGQHNGTTIAASSAKLVSLACHLKADRSGAASFKLGYAGIETPYRGVRRLPPNSSLDLNGGAVRRFFPLEPVPTCALEEAWDFAFSRARRVTSGSMQRRPLLLSLTAGLDSRTTLAATRGLWPELTFFTYKGPHLPPHERDVLVALDIARALGLRHLTLDYSGFVPDPSVLAAIKCNTFSSHAHMLACAYHHFLGGHKYLHIRTNLMEITRSNLYGYHDSRPEFSGGPATARQMAQYYALAGKLAFSDRQVTAFEQYCELTQLHRALRFANAWDLYFVEHRMGGWHAGLVAESDVAFETIIAFNSREIIKRFMGVPQQTRYSSQLLRERLKRLLPEIAHIPINPKRYPLGLFVRPQR